jgi:AcrR family transcriptional regulator
LDGIADYLNTDLTLVSRADLTPLASALGAAGLWVLNCRRDPDGRWSAMFETHACHAEPGPNLAAMLDAVEALPAATRALWDACVSREFDMGYDGGVDPYRVRHALAPALLARLGAAGAALALSLYRADVVGAACPWPPPPPVDPED